MKFKFKEVFITGANGWLGRQLIKGLLEKDEDVLEGFNPPRLRIHSLILPHEDGQFLKNFGNSIKIVYGDIRKRKDCIKFLEKSKNSLLVHCAGVIHPKKVNEFYEVNYKGTKKIVETATSSGVKKIVVISSNSPIGCNRNKNNLFNEESEYNPYMNYGKSKRLMEEFLLGKIKKGEDITIIRPPWFYGENMPKRQITFYGMIRDGKFPVVGNGRNIRSKANVKNIVQGILLSSMLPIAKGQIYWIADEKPYTMIEIIETVREVLTNEFNISCKPQKIKLPFIFGQIAQVFDYIIQFFGFYNQKIHVASELNKSIACSIKKAKDQLGYNPKVSLYNGIKESLNKKEINNLL
tara:strand:+ start:3011 stop:4063 length:1053 start_codon:yes stop_codon:yes gene_type:complete